MMDGINWVEHRDNEGKMSGERTDVVTQVNVTTLERIRLNHPNLLVQSAEKEDLRQSIN